MRNIKATQTLPEIIAITGMRDFGPSGDEGSTNCPHCGARGRYVWYFICKDGSRHGAMRGCLKLYPKSDSRYSKLVQEAFDRQAKAKEENKRLASWWQEMVDAAEEFGKGKYSDHDAIETALRTKLYPAILNAESRRQDWLQRNGYGRKGRRF